jgi:hypothetical protein
MLLLHRLEKLRCAGELKGLGLEGKRAGPMKEYQPVGTLLHPSFVVVVV